MALPNFVQDFEQYGSYTILNRNIVSDGRGGTMVTWTPGATFNAAVILDDSPEMRVAQAQGVVGNYTVTFEKQMRLPWHTVFRREKDGQIFRVTSRDDAAPPSRSTIKTRITTAEEWVLPVDPDEDDG